MSREAMKQPEALRLADALEELDAQFSHTGLCGEAAAELRRLALKQWVGLTDDEIGEVISGQFAERNYWVKITKALEAKLKEKNHGQP